MGPKYSDYPKIGPKHLNWFQFEWQAADGSTVTHAVGDGPIRRAR
jgi:hypothetical protein